MIYVLKDVLMDLVKTFIRLNRHLDIYLSIICLEYTRSRLWEMATVKNHSENADSTESFDEYLKWDHNHNTSHGHPVSFAWQQNTDLFSDDMVPYYGDVLFIYYRQNYAMWVKVSKDEEPRIRQYLESIKLVQV
jgi:hypothetical protein